MARFRAPNDKCVRRHCFRRGELVGMCGNVTYLGLLAGAGTEETAEPLRLQHLESHAWASTHSYGFGQF